MGPSLTVAAKMALQPKTWPTPRTEDRHHPHAVLSKTGRRLSRDGKSSHSLNLATCVALPQPTLPQEAPSSTSGSHQESLWMETDRSSTTAPMSSDSSETVSYQTQPHEPSPSCGESYVGKLNPRWVETLMGLPVGWVRPSADDNDNDND